MAWRHRFAPDIWNRELPCGIVDESESPEEAAARELIEETGYKPRSMVHLITFEPAVGMLRNPHYVFLSRGAEKVGDPTEANEGKFEWVPLARIPRRSRHPSTRLTGGS